MLSRIVSKEILLIAEDTIQCIPYVKKKVLKVLSNCVRLRQILSRLGDGATAD